VLTLVTGPANAEKARVVLDGYRAAADRGPLLVVPTIADADRYRRELAEGGHVFGARVVRFGGLVDELARRVGLPGRALTPLQRERVAAVAARSARLDLLAASAATPGFARALARLAAELEGLRVTPARFTEALRAWAREDEARSGYAEELARLVRADRDTLERTGRPDAELRLAAAIDALRADPARWGATPVFLYGFDDLLPLQREAVVALARAGAEVCLSLTYEPGRFAFAGRTETIEALRPAADRVVELAARAEHYAPGSREALHRIERRLFEPEDAVAPLFAPAPPGEAVTLLEGGGERAELELVAAEAARLVREEGVPAEEIAVVVRDPRPVAALVRQVFGALGLEVALDGHVRFGHTPLGRGLVALVRCALLDGTADDLVAWLRSPGVLREPALADALEAQARREGARTAAEARALWEARHWPLAPLDRVRAAAERGTRALCETLAAELAARFAAPHARRAEVLDGAQALQARVLAAGRRALGDVADLAGGASDPARRASDRAGGASGPGRGASDLAPGAPDRAGGASGPARGAPDLAPTPAELAGLLAGLDVWTGDRPRPGAVAVTDPLALRARRVRALFIARLQEGAFPAPARPEPFLGDAERRELARASGLVLRRTDDALGAERFLLYATVSRPKERLYLSWHMADDDGEPAVRSLFVDDVADLFGPPLGEARRVRALGEVGWPDGRAPTERERRRGEVAAGPDHREAPPAPLRHPEVLARLAARPAWSASDLEAWGGCPVKWFVERCLRPDGLEPDPEHLVRGAVAHAALEAALRSLVATHGDARLTPERLPAAREAVRRALDGLADRFRLSTDPRRLRALARRLEVDLVRYVEHAAQAGSALVPAGFEVGFGAPGDAHPPLRLADDVALAGRIDRIDRGPGGQALVYDYKGRRATEAGRWVADRKWQVALYLLAARDVLGLEPVGGLYQPLGAKDLRPRGLLREDADPELHVVAGDRRDDAAFQEVLDAVVAAALAAARELRAGALEPRPASCAWEGGCSYPAICRCEGA